MKQYFLLILLICSLIGNSQDIYEYEKEIRNKENYISTIINFQNTDEDLKISGTLLTPKTDFSKIVIIVPGSGKDTRYAHFILADELLKNGIAVYRFDERGVGKSEGKYSRLAKDLSTDLSFSLKNLQQKYRSKKFGVIGHSLGGIATLELIATNINLDFIILIETPIIKNGAFILNQFKMDYVNSLPEKMRKGKTKNETLTFLAEYLQVISNNTNAKSLKKEVKNHIKNKGFNNQFVFLLKDELLIELAKTNLEGNLKKSSIKTLYLSGTKDKIINHKEEISLIESFNNSNIETHIFEGLNHYLSDRKETRNSSVYQMDEEPLSLIINWTLKN